MIPTLLYGAEFPNTIVGIITVAEVYCKLSEISMLGTLVFFLQLLL